MTFGSINCARKRFFVLLQLHQPSSLFKSLEILGPFLRKGITEQFRSQRVRADYSEKHKRAKEIVKAYKAFCRKNSRRNAAVGFVDFFGPRRRQESRLWMAGEYSCPWKAASEKRTYICASRSQAAGSYNDHNILVMEATALIIFRRMPECELNFRCAR